jgi:hydrogenase nickel incorporation protein HypA/HybF
MTDVLNRALSVCEEHGGTKVTKITLKVGVMSGIVAAYVQSFFDVLSKGSAAEGAEIVIENDPAVFTCRKCGARTEYPALSPEYVCSQCGSGALHLEGGYGLQIMNIGIV